MGGARQSGAAGIDRLSPRLLLSSCRKRSKCPGRLRERKRLHPSSGARLMEVTRVGNWTQEQPPRAECGVQLGTRGWDVKHGAQTVGQGSCPMLRPDRWRKPWLGLRPQTKPLHDALPPVFHHFLLSNRIGLVMYVFIFGA